MSFNIYTETRENINFLILKNNKTSEYVEIIPDLGGTVHKVCLDFGEGVKNILFSDIDSEIIKCKLHKGRILFPFNDLIPGGKYTFNNKEYQFDTSKRTDGNAKHGFIKFEKLKLINKEINSTNCSVKLCINITNGQFQGYPFDIFFSINYILYSNQLKLEFEIENKGKITAPIALGWHPYFTFDNSLINVFLKCNSKYYYEIDKNWLPIGKILECKNTQFDFSNGSKIKDIDIDNAFFVPDDGKVYLNRDNNSIEYYQDPKVFKFIQFFIPPDHNSIAIEPITAAANAFNKEELGLIKINPGEIINTYAEVEVQCLDFS